MHECFEVAATLDDLVDWSAIFRITVQGSPTLVSLKLEGNLARTWVSELGLLNSVFLRKFWSLFP